MGGEAEEKVIKDILKAVKSIKFGHLQIIVHDSKIAQVDKTEKIRFDQAVNRKGN